MNNTNEKAARFTSSDFFVWRAERRALFKTVLWTVLKARVPSENTSTVVRSMIGVAEKKIGSNEKTLFPMLIGALKGTRTPEKSKKFFKNIKGGANGVICY